ncbi:hypothetical protein Moror_9273 [Moniliophthora roreri MCA 2997]|uniref:Uncharacterized protein n=1 Tax=Moniliophthora roreri (strain MCA 2997) TaxID=1381753 RepID=V2X080_MONRO|nr:hypothetical protein Moror_9273 [Moniliophthora roreri MCA 2997]
MDSETLRPLNYQTWAEAGKALPPVVSPRKIQCGFGKSSLTVSSTSVSAFGTVQSCDTSAAASLPTLPQGGVLPVGLKTILRPLYLTSQQQSSIIDTYMSCKHTWLEYEENDTVAQDEAKRQLEKFELDYLATKHLESQWTNCWSATTEVGYEGNTWKKRQTIYQYDCGYDQKVWQQKAKEYDAHFKRETTWQRCVPYDFTGCLAHVEVVEFCQGSRTLITRISGILEHNEACCKAEMAWKPAIPLHEHVYEVALDQLVNGTR